MLDKLGFEAVHPWWLLLLPLIFIEVFIYVHRYGLQKAHTHLEPTYRTLPERLRRIQSRIRFALPTVFKALTFIFVVLALAEITRGYVWTEETVETPNVLLLIDSSGSMFQGWSSYASVGMKPITCGVTEETDPYPRMKGMCRALKKFADMTEEMARAPYQKKKPLVSLMIFARDPAIVLFPTTDYRRLRDQIDHFEWSSDLLGGDTNIHMAFYAALLNLIFRYAADMDTPSPSADSGPVPSTRSELSSFAYAELAPSTGSERSSSFGSEQTLNSSKESVFTEDEIKLLRKSLRPQSGRFTPPPELNTKLAGIKPGIQEWTMLILTDAAYDDLKYFEQQDPSFWRLMDFAAYLGLRTYFISTENFLARIKLAAQATGGDFFLIRKDDPLVNMEKVVKEVFEKHLNRTTTVKLQKRESYSWWCTLAGLIFFLSWLIAEYTFARSLTGDI
jgi:hypothetical protein